MARSKFSELRSKMSAESQARAKAQTDQMLGHLRLSELRKARELTQQQLANELNVNQAWISKVERQADMYLSTLRSYVEAIGGELEINARFGDQTVRINHLNEMDIPEQTEAVAESTSERTEASVGERKQFKVAAVYSSSQDLAPHGVELWRSSGASITGSSRTPDSNTTSATSRAA